MHPSAGLLCPCWAAGTGVPPKSSCLAEWASKTGGACSGDTDLVRPWNRWHQSGTLSRWTTGIVFLLHPPNCNQIEGRAGDHSLKSRVTKCTEPRTRLDTTFRGFQFFSKRKHCRPGRASCLLLGPRGLRLGSLGPLWGHQAELSSLSSPEAFHCLSWVVHLEVAS